MKSCEALQVYCYYYLGTVSGKGQRIAMYYGRKRPLKRLAVYKFFGQLAHKRSEALISCDSPFVTARSLPSVGARQRENPPGKGGDGVWLSGYQSLQEEADVFRIWGRNLSEKAGHRSHLHMSFIVLTLPYFLPHL